MRRCESNEEETEVEGDVGDLIHPLSWEKAEREYRRKLLEQEEDRETKARIAADRADVEAVAGSLPKRSLWQSIVDEREM